MKSIDTYIIEKLHINKNVKSSTVDLAIVKNVEYLMQHFITSYSQSIPKYSVKGIQTGKTYIINVWFRGKDFSGNEWSVLRTDFSDFIDNEVELKKLGLESYYIPPVPKRGPRITFRPL